MKNPASVTVRGSAAIARLHWYDFVDRRMLMTVRSLSLEAVS
jgi:hypothetical protein